MTEEELFFNETKRSRETVRVTKSNLYNLLLMLHEVPGVVQLGMHGFATKGEEDRIRLTVKCGAYEDKPVYFPEFEIVPATSTNLFRESEIIKMLFTILRSIGLGDITSNNPVAQAVAFQLLTESGKFEDLVKLNVLYPIVKKHTLSPKFVTEEAVYQRRDPCVGRIFLETGFTPVNTAAQPQCFGKFESGVLKPWEYGTRRALFTNHVACLKCTSRDEYLESKLNHEDLRVCSFASKCQLKSL